MSQAVQVNIRMDSELKRQGDTVFDANGISTTSAIRELWSYVARTGDIPSFMRGDAAPSSKDALAEQGMGLAWKIIGMDPTSRTHQTAASLDYESLRDETYDALLDRLEAHYA